MYSNAHEFDFASFRKNLAINPKCFRQRLLGSARASQADGGVIPPMLNKVDDPFVGRPKAFDGFGD